MEEASTMKNNSNKKIEATGSYVSKYSLEGTEEDVVIAIREAFDRGHYFMLSRYPEFTRDMYELYLDWEATTYGVNDSLTVYVKRPELPHEAETRVKRELRIFEETQKREFALLQQLASQYHVKIILPEQ